MLKGPEGNMRYRPLHAHLVARRCRLASLLATVYAVGPQTGQPPPLHHSACCCLLPVTLPFPCLVASHCALSLACCQSLCRFLGLLSANLQFARPVASHSTLSLPPVTLPFPWLVASHSTLPLACCQSLCSFLGFLSATLHNVRPGDSNIPSAFDLADLFWCVHTTQPVKLCSSHVTSFCSRSDAGSFLRVHPTISEP